MRRGLKHKLLSVFVLIFCLLAAIGCSKTKVSEIEPEKVTAGEASRTAEASEETAAPEETSQEEESLELVMGGMKEVHVYSFVGDTFEITDVAKIVPEDRELTAEYVVELVLEEFSANSLEVGVLDVTEEDGEVIVNFDSSMPPCTGVGAKLEETILDCISHSLLDNVDGCKKVYLRMDGQQYESGHYLYGLNESYE